MPLRIHTDENVDTRIAEQLRRRGIDAWSARDLELLGASDAAQLAVANASDAILFTHDRGLMELAMQVSEHGDGHAGLIFINEGALSLGESIRRLEQWAEVLEPSDCRNQVWRL